MESIIHGQCTQAQSLCEAPTGQGSGRPGWSGQTMEFQGKWFNQRGLESSHLPLQLAPKIKPDWRVFLKRTLSCIACLLITVCFFLKKIAVSALFSSPIFYCESFISSLIAQLVKNLPAMQETPVRFLGWEDPREKE